MITHKFGALTIDEKSESAFLRDEKIRLTNTDFDLLLLLAKYKNKVLSGTEIETFLGSTNPSMDGSLAKQWIYSLRKKLGKQANEKIVTIKGRGYKLLGEDWE